MTDRGECTLCHNVGMVSVPSLRALHLGAWGTQAVLCRCALGRWVSNRQGGYGYNGEPRPSLLTIDDYERQCPDWRRLLLLHDEECRVGLIDRYGSVRISAELEEILKRILERLRDV